MGRSEIKNNEFEINSVLPTIGEQNKFLYYTFNEYKKWRGIDQDKANEALHKVMLWLDPLVIRYAWAAFKWPKRDDFHDSYYRDFFRLRVFDKLKNISKEDLIQELRLQILIKLRKYRVGYKAPVGGYVSKALYYKIRDLAKKDISIEKLKEQLKLFPPLNKEEEEKEEE